MIDARQLPLQFDQRPALEAADFLVTPVNAAAVAWIDRWPDWPGPLLTVWGPEGAGKTHLAQVFLAKSGGRMLDPAALSEALSDASASWVLDAGEALAAKDEAGLFHLFNGLKAAGGHLLITARTPPARWPVGLPDLASRLKGSAAVEITAPDDALLAALIVKHFSDRQVRVDAEVVSYLVARMDRSFRAAADLAQAIDQAALAAKRRITVPLVREVLRGLESVEDSPGTR